MTVIVKNQTPNNNSEGSGFLIGVVLIIIFVIIFIYFGIPALRNMGPTQLNVPAPQVVMPDKIDVNVNQSE